MRFSWILKLLFDFEIKDLSHLNVFVIMISQLSKLLVLFFMRKTKQFEIDDHFIREKVSDGVIKN